MRHTVRILVVGLALLAAAVPAHAQVVTVAADRFELLTGPCTASSGSGSPEGVVTGKVCDTYLDTATDARYAKASGTGTTGWALAPRLAALNVWTAQQEIAATEPIQYLTATGQAANAKDWRFDVNGTTWSLQTVNDAKSSVLATPIAVDRTTNGVTLASGLTAGSGAVSIINTAGKIPALTSTYIAALAFDAANLTGTIPAATLAGRSLADLGTRSATDLSSGNLAYARLPSGSGTWSATPTISGTVTVGADVNPVTAYTSTLGALTNKYLALHAAELWVETLVAQNTLATIAGRMLVAPTTQLVVDRSAQLGTPTTPTVTPTGVTGATAYSYKITAKDVDGETLPGAFGSTATGNAVLSVSNFNRIAWVAVTGATQYSVYGRTSGSWLLITTTAATTFDDTGALTPSGAVPAANTTAGKITVKHNSLANADNLYSEANGKVEYWLVNQWPIVAVSTGSKTFSISTDQSTYFISPRTLVITGSTGNNGTYTVASSSYNSGTNRTTITVVEAVPNGTADGAIKYIGISATAFIYPVTRDRDSSGSNDWYAGDALLDTGTPGKGFLDLYSVSGVASGASGPSIVGNVRTGTAYNNIAARWAVGNLNGLYGYVAETYGSAFGDASGTNITVDATNGLRIRNGTTNKFVADTAGNLSLTGDLAMSTSGVFRAGASAFGVGTGWWLDYNGGTPRFIVGNPSGNRVKWNGTDIEIVSANLTANANGVTIVPATGGAPATSKAYAFTVPTGFQFMAGDDDSFNGRNLRLWSTWSGAGTRTATVELLANAGGSTPVTLAMTDNGSTMSQVQILTGGGLSFVVGSTGLSWNGTSYWADAMTINGAFVSTSTLAMTASSADFETGSMAAANTPLIDFHSSGNVNDYDARIIASGGSATAGQGNLALDAWEVSVSGARAAARVMVEANNSNGTGFATVRATSDTASFVMQSFGSTWSNVSDQIASGARLGFAGSGGMSVTTTGGDLRFYAATGGTVTQQGYFDSANGGLVIGSPASMTHGVGTINAQAVYDDGVLLTDWVFAAAYDGAQTPDGPTWPPSTRRLFSLADVRLVTKRDRHLPWMPSADTFDANRSVGGMLTRIWQGQEQQQLYLFELEDRIAALEAKPKGGQE